MKSRSDQKLIDCSAHITLIIVFLFPGSKTKYLDKKTLESQAQQNGRTQNGIISSFINSSTQPLKHIWTDFTSRDKNLREIWKIAIL